MEVPNRALTPDELAQLKEQSKLDKALFQVEERYIKRAEVPSLWFGRLLAVLVVAIFLDITGWIAAFLDGKFYAVLAFLLQTTETICIIGMAGLAIFGTVEAYKKHQDFNRVKEEHAQG